MLKLPCELTLNTEFSDASVIRIGVDESDKKLFTTKEADSVPPIINLLSAQFKLSSKEISKSEIRIPLDAVYLCDALADGTQLLPSQVNCSPIEAFCVANSND